MVRPPCHYIRKIRLAPFNFSVDSALLRELGEKLVSTVHVALSELVKNAYDADASAVSISITPTLTAGPKIVIEDNGSGMTPDEVASFWMRIGTTNKEDHPTSRKFGRPRTGKKGVGRFACRRLGTNLTLLTSALVQEENGHVATVTTEVIFNWEKFTPGTTVESIPCEGTTSRIEGVSSTGTRLEISGAVTNEWLDRGHQYLRRQLAVIAGNSGAQRPGFEEDPGFSIKLSMDGEEQQGTDIREQIIDASWGTLTATVDNNGCAHFILHAFGIGGKKVYETGPHFLSIAGAKLKVGILPASKDDGVRDPKLLANYVLNKLVDEWGGVQVRYNGFRMYPYGNPGDDWLNIDADRGRRLSRPVNDEMFNFASTIKGIDSSRVLLNMLGMRNYLGQVEISTSMRELEPRLDRQGFVETPAFLMLRNFCRMAIEWATIHREAFVRQRATAEAQKAIENLAPILNTEPSKLAEGDAAPRAAEFLRKEITRLVTTLPGEEQNLTRQSLLRTVKALEAISADNQNQLRHLRLVASASTLTLMFAHEVRSAISSLGAGSSRLRALARKIPEHREQLDGLSKQLGSTQEQLSRLVDMTGIVGAFRSNQAEIEVNARSAIERAISCFRLVIENYSIRIDYSSVRQTLLVGPIIEGEVYSILINLLSNAIKSVIAAGSSEKRIRVNSVELGNKVLLRISDNGLGLDAKHYNDVFAPFLSDPSGQLYDQLEENANPEDAAVFGTGSGLGLSIARDIARARKGDIRFVNPDPDWAACVEIELP